MDYQAIQFEISDRVATITLNRPERMNSSSDELLTEWTDAIVRCQDDEAVRVVVITGAGRAFCAGADLRVSGAADNVLMQDSGPSERRKLAPLQCAPRAAGARVPRQALHRID